MNSTLKILIPLGLLAGGVFAVTYFLQHKPAEEEKAPPADCPLQFFTSSRKWNPDYKDPENRVDSPDIFFPGLFEPGTRAKATFWFDHPGESAVTMQLATASCGVCSDGGVALIPPDATRDLLQMTAVAALPQGLLTGVTLPPGLIRPAAVLVQRTEPNWQRHAFKTTDWQFVLPGTPPKTDNWSPQWGILELGFDPGGKTRLGAQFTIRPEGAKGSIPPNATFKIEFATVPPFAAQPDVLKVPTLTTTSGPHTESVIVVSATRGFPPGDHTLPVPTLAIQFPDGERDPGTFIKIGKAIQLTRSELAQVEATMAAAGHAGRLQSGYRIPITISPKVGKTWLDIGPLERTIWVTTAEAQKQIPMRGEVRGEARLREGFVVDLDSFRRDAGITKAFFITTDRPDIGLEQVEGVIKKGGVETRLEVGTPEKLPDEGGRGQYRITVTVPPNAVDGEFVGRVVLDIKRGSHPQRIVIPIKGGTLSN